MRFCCFGQSPYALLHALDYSRQADEMSGNGTWKRLDYVSGDYRLAVVAALLRQDAINEYAG